MDVLASLLAWIEENARRAPHLLLPVSGGSDSALVFWLLNAKYAQKTTGIYSGNPEQLKAKDWFLSTGNLQFVPAPDSSVDVDTARWCEFLLHARRCNAWLVGSRNRTEDELGTFSIASRVATFLPIAGVWKSDVMRLCDRIGVPEVVTASSRRADPACGRPEELAEIPLEVIDLFLKEKVGELKAEDALELSPQQRAYLERVYRDNRFRRFLPVRGPLLQE